MNEERRKVLRTIGGFGLAFCTGGFILNSCSKEVLSPFKTGYKIDLEKCNGCGDCLEYCYYNAILLPEASQYFIDLEKCTDCGKCVPKCKQNAMLVVLSEYEFEEDKCVGCGKCIDVCVKEGNCIEWEKEEYTVRNKCKPNSCRLECAASCPEGAITIGDRAKIDMSKCTKCGECVPACPFEAINPAKVSQEEDDCTKCGACYKVCEFDAIIKNTPSNYKQAYIDMEICNSCGECIDLVFCPDYDAIGRNLNSASIDRKLCTDCGKCETSCTKEAIKLLEL